MDPDPFRTWIRYIWLFEIGASRSKLIIPDPAFRQFRWYFSFSGKPWYLTYLVFSLDPKVEPHPDPDPEWFERPDPDPCGTHSPRRSSLINFHSSLWQQLYELSYTAQQKLSQIWKCFCNNIVFLWNMILNSLCHQTGEPKFWEMKSILRERGKGGRQVQHLGHSIDGPHLSNMSLMRDVP
jgi:hypothetical protein